MTGTTVDEHGFTRNISCTTDPAGSFAVTRRPETSPAPLTRTAAVPAKTQLLPSELWAKLSRDDWRAGAKALKIPMGHISPSLTALSKGLKLTSSTMGHGLTARSRSSSPPAPKL